MTCSKCNVNRNFMYYLNKQYMCNKCISNENIKTYKFYV